MTKDTAQTYSEKSVTLKPGKDRAVRNRHRWVFSGAIKKSDAFADGEILTVRASNGEILGYGTFRGEGSLAGRMLSFGNTDPIQAVRDNIASAVAMRRTLFDEAETNGYRLINGEGDGLPGLVVDRYGDVLVVQITSVGMDKLKDLVVEVLSDVVNPRCIYERSVGAGRRTEGLQSATGELKGQLPDVVEFREYGVRFTADVVEGQKTGFFLDHREMRQAVRSMAKGKRVLNAFSYTGGFSMYALAGGAKSVDSVDISQRAVELCDHHVSLNAFAGERHRGIKDDVFQFLREQPLDYELVVLDPPAFAKKKRDLIAACRGYKDLNRLAIQKMPKGSILITSSCSYHVDPQRFQQVVFQAALEAGREVKMIGRHAMAADHPVSLFHPEGEYLKSLVLYVE